MAIMVSDDTRSRTQEMLEQGGWFGMEEDQVTLMKQEKVAAIQVWWVALRPTMMIVTIMMTMTAMMIMKIAMHDAAPGSGIYVCVQTHALREHYNSMQKKFLLILFCRALFGYAWYIHARHFGSTSVAMGLASVSCVLRLCDVSESASVSADFLYVCACVWRKPKPGTSTRLLLCAASQEEGLPQLQCSQDYIPLNPCVDILEICIPHAIPSSSSSGFHCGPRFGPG